MSNKSKQVYNYTVILEREEEGGYHAFCPLLKGCHSQGDTFEEAIANIQEAIELYLESDDIPAQTQPQEKDRESLRQAVNNNSNM
jgi:predicted RNase H-like HicB family nuclease